MHTLGRVVLGVALAGIVATVPGCAVAQAPPPYYGDGYGYDTPPAALPDEWGNSLGAYGSWRTVPRYGTVWSPSVAAGWRPYTYGHWGSGPAGWTWFSSEPWGFTFNYGRWAWAPIGWVWVPGFVWGPAWVDWYWGNGYVGWAPLGYYRAVPWAQFVFVRDYDFGCDDVHRRYYKHPPRGGGYHHGPPPRRHIDRVSREPIVRVSAAQLPYRTLPPRGQDTMRQRPSDRPSGDARAPYAPPRGGGQVTTTPPATYPTAPRREQRGPHADAPPVRPQSGGGGQPRYYDEPRLPRGNQPQAAPWQPSPPRVNVPQPNPTVVNPPSALPPETRPPQAGPAMPQQRPQAPSVTPSSPRAASPQMPAAPTGQDQRMQPAPSAPSSSGFTGAGRGSGQGRGVSSPGMR